MIDHLWLIWLVTCIPVYVLNVWLWRFANRGELSSSTVSSEFFLGVAWVVGSFLILVIICLLFIIELKTPQWLKKLHGRGEE